MRKEFPDIGVAHWKLDGNGNDSSGNGNPLNADNLSFTTQSGLTYANFSGTANYGYIDDFTLPSTYTIALWLNSNQNVSEERPFYIYDNQAQKSLSAYYYSGNLTCSYPVAGGGSTGISVAFSFNEWALIYIQREGNNISMSKFVSETPTSKTYTNADDSAMTGQFKIGGVGYGWYGGISNVIIDNKYWSDAEKLLWFNLTKSDYGY